MAGWAGWVFLGTDLVSDHAPVSLMGRVCSALASHPALCCPPAIRLQGDKEIVICQDDLEGEAPPRVSAGSSCFLIPDKLACPTLPPLIPPWASVPSAPPWRGGYALDPGLGILEEGEWLSLQLSLC